MKTLSILMAWLLAFSSSAFAGNLPTAIENTLELKTATGNLKGTLLNVPSEKSQTVVLIIAGSGPTDKDGNNPMMKNNHLKLVAEELSRQGIASLRYDKRGIGENQQPGLDEKEMRFENFVNDAADWITELKKDPRFKNVVVLGHSEGSLI